MEARFSLFGAQSGNVFLWWLVGGTRDSRLIKRADKADEERHGPAFDDPPTPEELEANQNEEATESIGTSAPYCCCSRGVRIRFCIPSREPRSGLLKSKRARWDSCSIAGAVGPLEGITANAPVSLGAVEAAGIIFALYANPIFSSKWTVRCVTPKDKTASPPWLQKLLKIRFAFCGWGTCTWILQRAPAAFITAAKFKYRRSNLTKQKPFGQKSRGSFVGNPRGIG